MGRKKKGGKNVNAHGKEKEHRKKGGGGKSRKKVSFPLRRGGGRMVDLHFPSRRRTKKKKGGGGKAVFTGSQGKRRKGKTKLFRYKRKKSTGLSSTTTGERRIKKRRS